MTIHDIYLVSPELAMAGVAILVLFVDIALPRRNVVFLVAFLGLLVPFLMCVFLWGDTLVLDRSALFNTVTVDKFALFFKFLILGVVGVLILGSADYVERFSRTRGEFYTLILFSSIGMMFLASARELVSIYISLELTALPLVALAAFIRDERSSEAGFKFLILSGVSSAFLLYGMVLVYGFTGSTHLEQIALVVTEAGLSSGTYAMFAGIGLMVVGFGFKISMVPFQMWVPDVYEGAPTPVTAYLAVASKAAGFAVIIRVFHIAFQDVGIDWGTLFAVLSGLSMTVGNLLAISQTNVKRLLGYSTVAHAGYLLMGVAAMTSQVPSSSMDALGPSSVLFYLVGYAATNLAVFFALIAMIAKTGSEQINDLKGMVWRAPVLCAILTIGMVSLIGIPPTVGFMGKLYLFNAAISNELVWLALVGVINVVISSYYYLRLVTVMYRPSELIEKGAPCSMPVRLALGITVLGVVGIGIIPGPILDISEITIKAMVVAL